MARAVIELSGIEMPNAGAGPHALAAYFEMAEAALARLRAAIADSRVPVRAAVIGRVRGTGPNVSFGSRVAEIERVYPIDLASPFEGTESVAGGVWLGRSLLDGSNDCALMKLRFAAGTTDLPMHVHEHSSRFIVVLEGRGYYHVSREEAGEFTGRDVRCVPVRERDALIFSPGVMHTFSTGKEPLVLLSYHDPYIPLHDPRQFTVPVTRHCPAAEQETAAGLVACDPAWTVL